MRYFAKIDMQDNVSRIYRFEVQPEKILEEYWDGSVWVWDKHALIVGYLMIGEPDLDEVSEAFAREKFPKAFEPQNFEKVFAADSGEYAIRLIGSSLIGVAFEKSIVERTFDVLADKMKAGNLKCFTWWCERCKVSQLELDGDYEGHVLVLSFLNVRKIVRAMPVDWQWQDPTSEWARNQGDPVEEFEKLVAKRSRPNWKVQVLKI